MQWFFNMNENKRLLNTIMFAVCHDYTGQHTVYRNVDCGHPCTGITAESASVGCDKGNAQKSSGHIHQGTATYPDLASDFTTVPSGVRVRSVML